MPHISYYTFTHSQDEEGEEKVGRTPAKGSCPTKGGRNGPGIASGIASGIETDESVGTVSSGRSTRTQDSTQTGEHFLPHSVCFLALCDHGVHTYLEIKYSGWVIK